MKLKEMTDQQLAALYDECWGTARLVGRIMHEARRDGNDELAEQYRLQAMKHCQKADEVYEEIRRRREKKSRKSTTDSLD